MNGNQRHLMPTNVAILTVQNQVMLELKTRVEELKRENDYQLRLKDMNYNEKIKELSEKFIHEIEALKTKNQVGAQDSISQACLTCQHVVLSRIQECTCFIVTHIEILGVRCSEIASVLLSSVRRGCPGAVWQW